MKNKNPYTFIRINYTPKMSSQSSIGWREEKVSYMNSETQESQNFPVNRNDSWNQRVLVMCHSGLGGVMWEEKTEVLPKNLSDGTQTAEAKWEWHGKGTQLVCLSGSFTEGGIYLFFTCNKYLLSSYYSVLGALDARMKMADMVSAIKEVTIW